MKVYLLSRRIARVLLAVCSLTYDFKYLDSVVWAFVCPFVRSTANVRACAPVGRADVSIVLPVAIRAKERVLLGLLSTWAYGQGGARGVDWDQGGDPKEKNHQTYLLLTMIL